MRISARLLCVTLALTGATRPLPAQATTLTAVQVDRLAALGRVWGAAKYFHPAFLTRRVAWDSALVASVPGVLAATSAAEYHVAVNALLATLGDAYTTVVPTARRPVRDAGDASVSSRWTSDSTLIVSIPRFLNDAVARLQGVVSQVSAARRVVFDLRGPRPSVLGEADGAFASLFDGLLASAPLATPRTQQRVQRSYAAPYEVLESGGEVFHPAGANPPRRMAFVLYADSDLPLIAWALQQAGAADIILDDARGLVINPWSSRASTYRMDLGEGAAADIRLTDVIGHAGGVLAPDTIAANSSADDAPLRVAVDRVRIPGRAPTPSRRIPDAVAARDDADSGDMRYPSLPFRLVALFRYWNAVHYFYPSAMPDGEDWDRVLNEGIVGLAAARDSAAYAVTLFEIAARLKDGHAGARSPAVLALRGEYAPTIEVEYIENQPVIVKIGRDPAATAAGLRVGDIVLDVDGESIPARQARLSRYSVGTRPEILAYRFAVNSILTGPQGSTARVTVRSADGRKRAVSLTRSIRPCPVTQCAPRPGPAFRLLPGNIGYADLALLNEAAVDSMFDSFHSTSAIIFDGRGYPRGTSFAIASRLAPRAGTVMARGTSPIRLSPDPLTAGTVQRAWTTPATDKPAYRGTTVVLINQYAQSQAEQAALSIAAMGATLIGSPTVGALGSTTGVMLPGGIAAVFPSGEWHGADGRAINRVGIQPHIPVRPTIAGVRAGRDEVLEQAIRFVRSRNRKGAAP